MRALAFAALAALASVSADVPLDTVLIENAYFRQPAPGRSVAAAYCKMTNTTGVQLTLVSFESPVAKSVEVHTTVRVGDMMRMPDGLFWARKQRDEERFRKQRAEEHEG